MRQKASFLRGIASMLIVGIALATAACSGTVTLTTTDSGTSTGTTSTTATTSPTSVPATTGPAATCSTLLPGATPQSSPASPAFPDAPLPSNSFAAAVTTHLDGNNILWSVYLDQICTNNTSVSAVQSFFSSMYPSAGWAYAPKLPFDGGYFQPCGDMFCWGKDTPQRFVGLEFPTAHGTSVTYQLRLFVPPAPPTCGFTGYPSTAYQPFAETFSGIYVALPPNSITTPDDASGGQKGLEICSTGTQASIITFMQTELPKQGFSIVSGSGTDSETWQNGGKQVHWSVPNPTGTAWEIDWRVPLP
jgi:hypothetical protein